MEGAMTGLVNTALALARHGLAVVPLWWPVEKNGRLACACGKDCGKSQAKHPIGLVAPNGMLSATCETGVLKHWWQRFPDANVGVSRERLVPFDVDPRHDGLESLAALERQYGKLPPTWSVKTGSGGLHFYFKRPESLAVLPIVIAENYIRDGKDPPFGPGIDIPAYLIAPPSLHICGNRYEWDDHPSDTELADCPAWILDRLNHPAVRVESQTAVDPALWAQEVGGEIREYRDQHAARVAGKLWRAISLDPGFAAGLFAAWNKTYCRPPLPADELKRIWERIGRAELKRLQGEEEDD
jgi:hypothetical protein